MVLPCIGSHDQTTIRPSRLTARIERRQMLADLLGAEAADQRQPAGLVVRIEDVDEPQQLVGLERRAAFEAERIFDAAAEFDMGMIGLARAVADPQHVAGGGVPVAGRRIDARHRLLVAEQQRLVAGVEIGACRSVRNGLAKVMPQARMKSSAPDTRSARSAIEPSTAASR